MTEITDERVEALAKHMRHEEYAKIGITPPTYEIGAIYYKLARYALEFIDNEGKEYVMPTEVGIYRDKEGDTWHLGLTGWYWRDDETGDWDISASEPTMYAPFTKVV